MEGPPLGPGGEDITWPDQVAPRGRNASSTRKIKPQTSNLWRDYLPQHVISGNKLRCAGNVLVPAALVPQVIAAVHSYVHGGIEKTYQLVRRRFSVPSLKLDDL